jgi:hypothetical protein
MQPEGLPAEVDGLVVVPCIQVSMSIVIFKLKQILNAVILIKTTLYCGIY